jgi:FkbM family methyltransferase
VTVARLIRRAIPNRWQVPARYYHQRARHLIEPEMELLVRTVSAGDCVVDIGANFGVFSYAFLRRGAVVHAFEPQPACLVTLTAYARTHPRFHVHPEALGDQPKRGVLTLPMAAPFAGSPGATLRDDVPAAASFNVQVAALDDFHLASVGMMKIDVEGGELDVLRGAVETIRRCRPLLMIEIEQRHHRQPVSSVMDEVFALGYRAEVLDAGCLVDVSGDSKELDELSRRGKYNFLFSHVRSSRTWAV